MLILDNLQWEKMQDNENIKCVDMFGNSEDNPDLLWYRVEYYNGATKDVYTRVQ